MAAKPREPAPPPKSKRPACAPQEAFELPAVHLADALGWNVPEEHAAQGLDCVYNDIRVEDARNYLRKSLHEAHQAGAKGEPMPSTTELCIHLAVDTPDEERALAKAMLDAHSSGKDFDFILEANQRYGELRANLVGFGAVETSSGKMIRG